MFSATTVFYWLGRGAVLRLGDRGGQGQSFCAPSLKNPRYQNKVIAPFARATIVVFSSTMSRQLPPPPPRTHPPSDLAEWGRDVLTAEAFSWWREIRFASAKSYRYHYARTMLLRKLRAAGLQKRTLCNSS